MHLLHEYKATPKQDIALKAINQSYGNNQTSSPNAMSYLAIWSAKYCGTFRPSSPFCLLRPKEV